MSIATLLLKGRPGVLTLFSWCLFSLMASAQNTTISGKVFDAKTQQTIIGASVKVKGTSAGTVSDAKGQFQISVSRSAILQISYIGYLTREVTADAGGPLAIALTANSSDLNEVVVVGYGTQRKASLTGAVATVSSKVFEDRGPVNNPLEALQGQLPGVIVTRSSAQPGRENWNFQIRGATSTNGQDPLVILDGVALNNNAELNSINPNDIDNISVLKDASASIYGSRAAFGVVLITTKKAKKGGLVIQYDGSVSKKLLGLQPTLINSRQWGEGLMQALTNDSYGIAPTGYIWYQLALLATNPPAAGYIDIAKLPGYTGTVGTTPYNGVPLPPFNDVKDFTFFDVNQQKILWQNATSTQHNLSFANRNDKEGYRVSLGYLNDGSQLRWGTNGNKRYNIRFNNDYTFSSKVKLETNVSLERQTILQPTLYSFGQYGSLSEYAQPGMPAFNAQGQPYAWGTVFSAAGADRDGGSNIETNTRALLNANFTYDFAKHLSFTATAGYSNWFQDSRIQQKQVKYYNYAGDVNVQTLPVAGGADNNSAYYQRGNTTDPYYNLISRVNYTNTFNQVHNIGIMLGASYERDEFNSFVTRTYNLSNDNIPSLNLGLSNGTAGFITNGETQNHYALGSYFGRANYDYKGKYLFEVTGRYDGSSRFIADKRWRLFGGAQAAWHITEEAFMKSQNIFSDLKLKASYGTAGNQGGIGLYDYIQSLSTSQLGSLIGTGTPTTVTTSGALVSLNRTWETAKKKNIGVEFSFFNNRLTGTFDYYRNENSNMLLGQTYPGVLGAAAPAQNIGDLKTWGYEGSLTWRSKVGSVSYSIGGTITDNQNKLVHYGGASVLASGFNATVEGYPLNSFFGLKYDGRLQTQAQVDAYNAKFAPTGSTNNIGLPVPTPLANPAGQVSGVRPGDNSFKDVNGDGKLSIGTSTSNPGDLVYLGSNDPRYSFGLNLGLQWNGFDFLAIIQGVAKRTIYRTGNMVVPFKSIFQGQSSQYIGNTWSPTTPGAYYPNLHSALNNGINIYNFQPSSWSVQNGAYARLKNLVIGYTFPKSFLSKTNAIKGLRIYASGSDLTEITAIHDGWDPEVTRTVSGNERFPFYRYVTLGVNVNF
ncbi:TonB-linked outer membrane protein, SusC/RagA family [Mucilaginibacter gossypiicola]|uniref:TonB-linked outer membrane protein, SusC/RagA family n=1 Tax=Mucilaginibacter gossypiicola TaxID=551995 RepID=A0A1H8LQ31_9SPHI|nr:TonB-dependent receptor [Mucilaginibacter gossypiicola]SEO07190.1 TonB-linked outer membrane protein, SusC/RagA family [Mucilaginibacter gossypiicola]